MIEQKKLYNTFIKLVSSGSISGTYGEVEIGNELIKMISQNEISKNNSLIVKKIKIKNDKLGRFAVFGHLRGGNSKDTIILNAHLDVVDIEEFAGLKDFAFNPEELTKRMSRLSLSEEVLKDLNSNKWLFGRGVADMKFGLALNVELLNYYAGKDDFNGNIIFIAVPGEETNSEGMREAVEYLAKYKSDNNLNYKVLFLSECYSYDSNNPDIHYIHYGAEGKIMPMMLFVGESTHANNPFGGIDSNMISSEFFNKFQLNQNFISGYNDKWSEPPICLKMKDFKNYYSAKPATFSLAYFNLPTIEANYSKIMKNLNEIANETLKLVINKVNNKRREFNNITGKNIEEVKFNYNVITYDKLYERALEKTDDLIKKRVNEIVETVETGLKEFKSIQDISGEIMKEVYNSAEMDGITIVIGVAPPFYPSHLPKPNMTGFDTIKQISNELITYGKNSLDLDMKISEFYPVSDLSFIPLEKMEEVGIIYKNMPGSNKIYKMPIDEMNQLKVPSLVLGPKGKDFHKITERINIEYALEKLPALYLHIINNIFSKEEGDN